MEELLKRNLKINKSQSKLLLIFYDKPKVFFSVKELISILDKDRTTIQKLLVVLVEKKLIQKRQFNLSRGFMFEYKINITKKEIFDMLKKSITENYKNELKKLNQYK